MQFVNFDTEQLVLVCYPGYAGGNFIINCLALSEDSNYYQFDDFDTIVKDKQLLFQKFINFINSQSLMGEWQDFFNKKDSTDKDILSNNPIGILTPISTISIDLMSPEIFPNFLFSPSLCKLTNDLAHKFFVGFHHPLQVDKILRLYKNAKLVVFENYRNFLEFRQRDLMHTLFLQPHWNNIKGDSWPESAPFDIESFRSYPKLIRDEVSTLFPEFINELTMISSWRKDYYYDYDKSIEKYKNNSNVIFWNVDAQLNQDQLLPQIEQLYKNLGLRDFNKEQISEFYTVWYTKLKQISEYK